MAARGWRRKARFELGQKVDRRILDHFVEHKELSTEEVRALLFKDGLCEKDYGLEPRDGRLSFTGVNKRISNMRVGGLLYYTNKPGNRLKLTLHGEAMLAALLLKEEEDEEGIRVQDGVPRDGTDVAQRQGGARARGERDRQARAIQRGAVCRQV